MSAVTTATPRLSRRPGEARGRRRAPAPRPAAPSRGTARPGDGRPLRREPLSGAQAPGWNVVRLHPPRTCLSPAPARRWPGPSPEAALGPGAALEQPTRPLPDVARHARVVVCAACEVLAGRRPVEHLARWTTPALMEALTRRAGLARRILGREAAPRMRARSTHVQALAGGAREVVVVLDDGTRVHAAAARLEPCNGHWLLTNLEMA
ncbi:MULTISPECIES: Rv3235 family protein [unclassified Actinomyces]|uniref:Rv3235 family protein n=1 Tax=unclassified Actinomyces TaxID=2609248 RepID=UPI00101AE15B|nr:MULTISPECIES: Rv3235 family protein [unclassified Actinomyces]